MLDSAVKSPFNNGNGLGSGTYVQPKKKKKKKDKNAFGNDSGDLRFFGILDELALVISDELKAMERAKRVNINFDTRI
jgi:hypothetical protein